MRHLFCLFLAALLAGPLAAGPITYQGQLQQQDQPFSGTANLEFRLFDAVSGGAQIGPVQTRNGVSVQHGLFQVELDFGAAAFDGSARFLEVRVNGTPLNPRQAVRATPVALYALAGNPGPQGEPGPEGPEGPQGPAGEPAADGWRLDGNAGTDSSSDFIGTVDAEPLELRIANVRGLRLEPSAELFEGLPITANVIAGSHANEVTPGVRGATIAGGGVPAAKSDPDFILNSPNRVTDHYGTIGGGYGNQAGDAATTVSDEPFATVGGGFRNAARGSGSTVGGGTRNTAIGQNSTISGGFNNTASSSSSSSIGGGSSNTASGFISTISGGNANNATGNNSTIGGGTSNATSGPLSTVSGGWRNTASGTNSTVSGGNENTASGRNSAVGGGEGNTASASGSTVGGGEENTASASGSTVGAGRFNIASGNSSWVGGGDFNTASGEHSTVSGGDENTASGRSSTIGGGDFNVASGNFSTVSGGADNNARAPFSSVGGGVLNCAGGWYSWAGGRRAKIRPGTESAEEGFGCQGVPTTAGTNGDEGTFIWADSQDANFVSTGPNQFMVRAQGGAVFTSSSTSITALGNQLRVNGTLRVDSLGGSGGSSVCRNLVNQLSDCSSSQRYKQQIEALTGEEALDLLYALRPVRYQWIEDGRVDIGLVAEEVADVIPAIVTYNDAGQIEGFEYNRLGPLLIAGFQHQQSVNHARLVKLEADQLQSSTESARLATENTELRAEVAVLKVQTGQMRELADRNAELERRLEALEALLMDGEPALAKGPQ